MTALFVFCSDISFLCGSLYNFFCVFYCFFFFKQKTAYEMRISDWSSDVCSSDLGLAGHWDFNEAGGTTAVDASPNKNNGLLGGGNKIGRASCRERVCQYV